MSYLTQVNLAFPVLMIILLFTTEVNWLYITRIKADTGGVYDCAFKVETFFNRNLLMRSDICLM